MAEPVFHHEPLREPGALPPLPDFFVVGAPRCGTTALSRYLSDHPAICFAKPKEPHYFAWIDPAERAGWRAEYATFFQHYAPEHRVVGEGSVSYLYSEDALERIAAVRPDARFIAMVRNPMEMIPSFHLRMLFLLEEDVSDLGAAWRLQEARARGEHVPSLCTEPRLLLYGEVGKLGGQVERLQRIAGAERCLVLLQDDLAADPSAVYRRALRFVGVDDDGRSDFPRRLPSQHYRFRWLQRALFKPPLTRRDLMDERLGRAARKARKLEPGFRRSPWTRRLYKRIRDWNQVVAPPRPLDPRLREEMREHFAPDIEKLAGLIGRDLSHWR